MRPSLRVASLLLMLGSAGACASAPRPAPERPRVLPPRPPPPAPTLSGPEGLPDHLVASLDVDEAVYFASRGDTALVLYPSAGRWLTRLLGADGVPATEAPLDVSEAGSSVNTATLRAAGDGYLAMWAEQHGENHAVRLLALDAAGRAVDAPALVTQSAEPVRDLAVLPNARGALLLWELPRGGRSDLVVQPAIDGKPVGAPRVVAREALGWEALATQRGAAIVVVESKRPDADLGDVKLIEMDPEGQPGEPIALSVGETAQIDPQVVEADGHYLVAWTDERDLDTAVYLAAVSPGGSAPEAARRVTPPLGEQALISLVADRSGQAKRALLAWEDILRPRSGGRPIYLATVGADGVLSRDSATLVYSGSGLPDIAPDGDGFAALTLATAGLTPGAIAAGADAPALGVVPHYVRFGADFSVRGGEPVRAVTFRKTNGVPELSRTLSCDAGVCSLLVSDGAAPATLASVTLPARASAWRPPAWRDVTEPAPRLSGLISIQNAASISRVASTSTSSGSLVASLSDRPTEEKTARDATLPSLTLSLRSIGPSRAVGAPVTLSNDASFLGGLALRSEAGGGAVLGWVSQEREGSRVMLTRLDPHGKKLDQVALTSIGRGKTGPSEVSDVALASDGSGGWVVAWVDTRDGGPALYAAKVDPRLRKVGSEQRVTGAGGDPAEPTLAVRGETTIVAWSDARNDAGAGGLGDIYTARLSTASLAKSGSETRIYASAAHSRSPVLSATERGLGVAWIEEAAPKQSASAAAVDAGVRIAWLTESGKLEGAPIRIASAGAATSVTMRCDKACRGVLTAAGDDGLDLRAFEVSPGAASATTKVIATLTSEISQDVSPSLSSADASSLFFTDRALSGDDRVRWASVVWKD